MLLSLYLTSCRDGTANHDIIPSDHTEFLLKWAKPPIYTYRPSNKHSIEVGCRILDISRERDKCTIGVPSVHTGSFMKNLMQ